MRFFRSLHSLPGAACMLKPRCTAPLATIAKPITASQYQFENSAGAPIPTVLHPATPVFTTSVSKTPASELKFERRDRLWTTPYVQAFLRSFESGDPVGLLELDRTVFGQNQRADIIARALYYEWSWLQAGTESTKARGQVRTSKRKAAPQKGRGRARIGFPRSPHHHKGYDAHGPRPHDKSTSIQKGVYDLAVRCALSTKFSQDQLTIVDSLSHTLDSSTPLLESLSKLGLENKSVYFLYGNTDDLAMKSFINAADSVKIPKSTNIFAPQVEKKLYVAAARNVSIMPMMENEHLVLDKAAVEYLEKMYHTD
ncbi:54S ribosomal protein L4 mitochondrial [Rhizophlyctis rosea]|uniref:Large ribosomal subunit protein uL4m n=1 Tax=Rhizophlyctis rosea TaxID=64517 RepID=A0AAD5X5C1_9FUNG|nr:54S ribosomal protein L4 mitochondrial [Rhizophlyctis rosea]